MSEVCALVIIKPMSVGRGDGPAILTELLDKCNLALYKFRSWIICDNTWSAVLNDIHHRTVKSEEGKHSWVCLFKSRDPSLDPTEQLNALCGPEEMKQWQSDHLRYRYSAYKQLGPLTSPSDTVVHIAPADRVILEACLLFTSFDGRI